MDLHYMGGPFHWWCAASTAGSRGGLVQRLATARQIILCRRSRLGPVVVVVVDDDNVESGETCLSLTLRTLSWLFYTLQCCTFDFVLQSVTGRIQPRSGNG